MFFLTPTIASIGTFSTQTTIKSSSFVRIPITMFDLAPYQKGDFIGSTVYQVVVEDHKEMSGVVLEENKTTKLVRTQGVIMLEQLNIFLSTIYGNELFNTIGAFIVVSAVLIQTMTANRIVIKNSFILLLLLISGSILAFQYRPIEQYGYSIGLVLGLCVSIFAAVSLGGLAGKKGKNN